DRDYFTITVPSGFQLTSLLELAGTQAGFISFIGIQAGNKVTVDPTGASAAGLLGWTHYAPVAADTEILPTLAIPALGSSGFAPPLGAGTYSFWIQERGPGVFPYGFDVVLSQVPEPAAHL